MTCKGLPCIMHLAEKYWSDSYDDDDVCHDAHLDCSVNHVAGQGCSHGSSIGVHSTGKASTTLPVR